MRFQPLVITTVFLVCCTPLTVTAQSDIDSTAIEFINPVNSLVMFRNDLDYKSYQGDLPGSDKENFFRTLVTASWPIEMRSGRQLMLRATIPFNGNQPLWRPNPVIDYPEFAIRQAPSIDPATGEPVFDLAVALSLLVLIYRVSFPHSAELGRHPETGAFEDVELHPEAVPAPYNHSNVMTDEVIRKNETSPATACLQGVSPGDVTTPGSISTASPERPIDSAGSSKSIHSIRHRHRSSARHWGDSNTRAQNASSTATVAW